MKFFFYSFYKTQCRKCKLIKVTFHKVPTLRGKMNFQARRTYSVFQLILNQINSLKLFNLLDIIVY